jgi:hypothetical protein
MKRMLKKKSEFGAKEAAEKKLQLFLEVHLN